MFFNVKDRKHDQAGLVTDLVTPLASLPIHPVAGKQEWFRTVLQKHKDDPTVSLAPEVSCGFKMITQSISASMSYSLDA